MKKMLSLVIAILILLLINGCTNKMNLPLDINVKTDQPLDNTVAVISTATSPAEGSKPWPTKSWSISIPEEQGLNSSELAKSEPYIRDNFSNVYSLLVVRHGYLVYEKYYNKMDMNSANQVYSVTKSVLSALTGIALQQKLIGSVDQTVAELIPEYFTQIDDAGKKDITLKNVLTMSGGLESIDNNYTPFFSSPDWLAYTLSKPLINKPGTKFVYNTGLIQFLPNIIAKASGMDANEFAEKYLFSQIGINCDTWACDKTGHYGGGTGLYLTPRDMAKFGYLYLNNGNWDGKQIIQKDWVEESTKKQIDTDDDRDYGYLFWLQTVHDSAKNTDYSVYRADGSGGQRIVIIPQLDMVAVVTANNDTATRKQNETENIVYNYVIPAVK